MGRGHISNLLFCMNSGCRFISTGSRMSSNCRPQHSLEVAGPTSGVHPEPRRLTCPIVDPVHPGLSSLSNSGPLFHPPLPSDPAPVCCPVFSSLYIGAFHDHYFGEQARRRAQRGCEAGWPRTSTPGSSPPAPTSFPKALWGRGCFFTRLSPQHMGRHCLFPLTFSISAGDPAGPVPIPNAFPPSCLPLLVLES